MNKYLQMLLKDTDMPVVFDYDGVLFEARWYVKRINMPDETEEKLLEAMSKGDNLYTEPIPYMRNFVSFKMHNKRIFVLSHIHNEIEYNFKLDQIHTYYPKISKVMWATSVDDKINHLQEVYDTFGRFIYIDDNHEALIKMENHFDENCKFFHSSSLFV